MTSPARTGTSTANAWAALDGPLSTEFGITRGTAHNRDSYYAAVDAAAVIAPDPDGDRITGTSREPSFDVSNNTILGNVSEQGYIFRMARSWGVTPAYETGLPGVYVNKDHDYVEGHLGIEVLVDGTSIDEVDTAQSLLEGFLPHNRSSIAGVDVTRVTFAPLGTAGLQRYPGLISVARISNGSTVPRSVRVKLHSAHKIQGDGRLTTTGIGFANEEELFLGSSETRVVVVAMTLDRAGEEARRASVIDEEFASTALAQTLGWLRSRYGALSIPEAPFYAAFLTRQAELARQAVMLDDSGSLAGSFWGSDANDRPDVWQVDLLYSLLPIANIDPELCRTAITYFCEYGIPPASWANRVPGDEGHPLPHVAPVSHSVVNATAALALADAYVRATGDISSLTGDDTFLTYGISLVSKLLDTRRPGERLFPAEYISDGFARGDFHTGSNIRAWHAIATMARLLAETPVHAQLAQQWKDEADAIRTELLERAVHDGVYGPEFAEGTWRDGGHVVGHDGEESDLTLAAYYGFVDVDDPRVLNHARSAFSTDNPYYVPELQAVSWWYFQWHEPTAPAFVHLLAGSRTPDELAAALDPIRLRTDLDGSVWWWPHHSGTSPTDVLRGPGKSGWAAGVYVSKFIHDVLGISTDAQTKTLRFRPLAPWSTFHWSGAQLGQIGFNAAYTRTDQTMTAQITNLTDEDLTVSIRLTVPAGLSAIEYRLDGEDVRDIVRLTTTNGRRSFGVEASLAPGREVVFELGVEQFAGLRDTQDTQK